MVDYQKHNMAVEKIWKAYREDKPIRIPVTGGMEIQTFLTMKNYSYKRYYTDPEFMIKCQLEKQRWCCEHIFADAPAELPEAWGPIRVDFWPIIAEGWLGCEIIFPEKDTPWVKPLLKGNNKEKLYDMVIPDPLYGNLMQKVSEFHQIFKENISSMTYLDRPIKPDIANPAEGTCGPFSDAINLRGATELLQDVYDDPQYVHRLLSFVTEAIIVRKRAWRKFLGRGEIGSDSHYCVEDHGIGMLSDEMYREFVMPYHKKLLETFVKNRDDCSISLHHCGRGPHLFRTIYEELGVRSFFNLTYPNIIDVMSVRRELGEEVYLGVGLHPEIVLNGPESRIYETIKNLMTPEVKAKGRLYWIQADFIPPGVPLKHIYAVYKAIKKFGRY